MFSTYLFLPFFKVLRITSNVKSIVFELEKFYGMYTCTSPLDIDGHVVLDVEVIYVSSSYYVYIDGKRVITKAPLAAINSILMQETMCDETVVALHGAAVECKGRAYVFLAATTSGKTTLVSYLTTTGLGYITDDCVLIDKRTLMVYPCATPLHLRVGGVEVLKRLGHNCQYCELLNGLNEKRFVYTPKYFIRNAVPIERVFFIERTEDKNSLEDISTIEVIKELLISPKIPYSVTPDYLKTLAFLSTKEFNRLHYSNMSYVRKVIEYGR